MAGKMEELGPQNHELMPILLRKKAKMVPHSPLQGNERQNKGKKVSH